MNADCLKDLRAGRTPMVIALLCLGVLGFADGFLGDLGAGGLIPMVLFVGAHYLGAFALGHEFDHQTLGLRLTQPGRRSMLWVSKLAISFGAVSLTYVLTLGLMGSNQGQAKDLGWFISIFAVAGFCGPPLFVQYTRSTLGAAAVSFLALILLITSVAFMSELFLRLEPGQHLRVFLGTGYAYGILVLTLASWKWNRFELRAARTRTSKDSRWSVSNWFLRVRRSTPGRNLWHREGMCQSRTLAFGIALSLILWIDIQLLKHPMWSPYADPMLILLILLPAGIVPLFAGLSCGQEKFEGTQFLGILQPWPFSSQVRIRLAIGLAIVVLFGCLAPFAGLQATHSSLTEGGAAVDRLLIGLSALICFGLGWFSTSIARTSLAAAGTSVTLVGITLYALVLIHHWVIPWLVVFSGLLRKPESLVPEWGPASSYWNTGFLFTELHDRPLQHLWFSGSLAAFVVVLIYWASIHSKHDHIPPKRSFMLFAMALGVLLLIQLVMGSGLCVQFLRV